MVGTVPGLVAGANTLTLLSGKTSSAPLAQVRVQVITQADCNAAKLGTAIPTSAIGEPVSGVNLTGFVWTAAPANGSNQAYCRVNGNMTPIDPAAPNINFGVTLPQRWAYRYAQMGGGGMNGSVPGLAGADYNNRGMATAGSDSGHSGFGNAWAVNDEAMKNLGYMQMKKTRDAAFVLQQSAYGATPTAAYWFGSSQGGREGLTMAQRYPNDYDGISVSVPIVNFSSLMLAPEWIRIQEKPLANWVTPAKRTAIATEVIRQCDGLDGLADGVINNYMACRAIFDVTQGAPGRQPWAAKRCPGNVDPNPADTTAAACLTDGQISTLQFTHQRYFFATPLAFNNPSFGMWLPGTDPGGSGLIESQRYRGQEGAAANAPIHSHLGIAGVTGFLYQDLNANPLDYVEGGALNDRRVAISPFLDATDPNLNPFRASGGKLLSVIGTNDTLASPGSQLDYYQSVINLMGQGTLDQFARFWVMPMGNHGLGGTSYNVNGEGQPNTTFNIPNSLDRVTMLVNWVERGVAPPLTATVTSGARSLPLCQYPKYPRYNGTGSVTDAASYSCANL
ncbi:tannase/feruloyl esterase family alpha/beta hydrolase [Schlegelella sp. ID0723]|uniref:Tannase/feruloyl esterase family alpha/beta hydrolase n=2 Tax=Piscinibacter koreensis TaxID=2742824 RepID=A0A7Y6TVB2_9BURK|nr:tannase/feruloyl esterase family alpha/beta hydrolase [Schlegelella koreensis]